MKRLLILLMLVSQPAWAGWVELATSGSGTDKAITHYWDPETVRKTPNGRRAWIMTDYDQPQVKSFGTFQSTKMVNEIDCAGERVRNLQVAAFSGPIGTGEVVASDNSLGEWVFAGPGSIGEFQLQAICRVPLR